MIASGHNLRLVTPLALVRFQQGESPLGGGCSSFGLVFEPETIDRLPTPALVVDKPALDRNIATMSEALPGPRLRPHVKAFKCTALAERLVASGHRNFTAATIKEVEGLAIAGLGHDILLANEVLDANRLGALLGPETRITVAVDSSETITAAVDGGLAEVLIDIDVGLKRCGANVVDAGRLADEARRQGLTVRGVMGYEGHLMMIDDPEQKAEMVAKSMARLAQAHEGVGGEVISAGGTGTYHLNQVATEIQAGSYLLMDTDYNRLGLPFEIGVSVLASVISVNSRGWFVIDAGLKSLGMDHGLPVAAGSPTNSEVEGEVWYCSDEHTTLKPSGDGVLPVVGDRYRLLPAHLDPTVSCHRQMWLVDGSEVVDRWAVDLRHW